MYTCDVCKIEKPVFFLVKNNGISGMYYKYCYKCMMEIELYASKLMGGYK